MLLQSEKFKHYIENFNTNDVEYHQQYIPNENVWSWLKDAMPLLDCPDKKIEETYYFRWWVYRKHLKHTEDGFVITEFLPPVRWSGKHNTINCSVGHHLNEGRWLSNSEEFLTDYITFWLKRGGNIRSYSTWFAYAIREFCKVKGDDKLALELLPDLVANFKKWEESNQNESGLFWSYDDRDAMELSISGSGLRPTLNSYMYADAKAISEIAHIANNHNVEKEFSEKASQIKKLILEKLWDEKAGFFKVVPLEAAKDSVETWDFNKIDQAHNVREQIGYIPWYFNIPDSGYEKAWEQLFDENGFYAPYGPCTAEQRHPRFMFKKEDHECLWNGPSWPFATSQTLTAMANVLNNYDQTRITKKQYLDTLNMYAKSHYRKNDDGQTISWLDENIDPFTGEWLSRKILEGWGWRETKSGVERGKDYNHSTFNDLVISGLIGIRPQEDDSIIVHPLVPEDEWDYFCLDQLSYRNRKLTVVYDKYGNHYGKGKGLKLYADGKEIGRAEGIGQIIARLPG